MRYIIFINYCRSYECLLWHGFLINLSFFQITTILLFRINFSKSLKQTIYILIELNIKMFSVVVYILKINLGECLDGNLDRFNCK